MKDCLFCKIANGEIPKDFTYENDHFVAFPDIRPIAPVHILIVSRKHIEGIQTVEEGDAGILGEMILRAKKIAEQKGLKGYKLMFNCGKLGEQEIFHLHLHLLGGWKTIKGYHQCVKKRLEEGGVL